jgi:hypothetical protein
MFSENAGAMRQNRVEPSVMTNSANGISICTLNMIASTRR